MVIRIRIRSTACRLSDPETDSGSVIGLHLSANPNPYRNVTRLQYKLKKIFSRIQS
jgi:hypothetical protein